MDALILGGSVYDLGWYKSDPVPFTCIHPNCWYPISYDQSFGGSEIRGVNGPDPTFTFSGSSFSIIYHQPSVYTTLDKNSKGDSYYHTRYPAIMTVTIDGVAKQFNQAAIPNSTALPTESSLWRFNQEWKSPKLLAGTHTVTFEHIDDRFNKFVNVDGIITTSLSGGITPEGQYKWYIQPQNCKGYGPNGKCGNWSADITIDSSATPSATPSAWFQLAGGSGYSKSGDISVTVPDTVGADNNQRVLSGLGGVADTTSTGFLTTGLGYKIDIPHYLGVTGRDWSVPDSSYFTPPTENFTYLKRLFELPLVPQESFYQREGLEAVLPLEGSTDGWTNGVLTTVKGDTYDEGRTYIYYHTGDLTVENPLTIADGTKRVIFVKGNVTLDQNITVASGSFFSIIATGNLTIAGTVTKTQGIYIVDKTITVEDAPDTLTGLSRQFEAQGTLVGWQGINLNRDLQDTNATNPAELFIYRPDFLINAPSLYKRFGIQWQEVVPGSNNP